MRMGPLCNAPSGRGISFRHLETSELGSEFSGQHHATNSRTEAPELDLYTQPFGFEFKRTEAPKLTPSMRSALEDLKLQRLFVVIPGTQVYSLHERVTVLGLNVLEKRLKGLMR
jgi:hypothetical protein